MADFSKEFLIRVRADIQQAVGDMKRLTAELQGQTAAAGKENKELSGLNKGLTRLAAAAGAYLSVQTAVKALRMADEYNRLTTQIKLATKATGDYDQVSRRLFEIAQRNGASLQTTVSLFRNIARAAGDIGASNADILTFTNAVQQLAAIGGTGPGALNNALLQLGQLIAGDVARAEEFNSILENTPEIAARIARGMNLTTAALRRQINAGKVLSKDVYQSILKQAPQIAEDMASIPDSLARGTTRLDNSMTRFLGQLDKAVSATTLFSGWLKNASSNLDTMSDFMEEQFGLSAQINDATEKRLKILKTISILQASIENFEAKDELSNFAENLLGFAKVGLSNATNALEKTEARLIALNEQALKLTRIEEVGGAAGKARNAELTAGLKSVNAELQTQIQLFEAQSAASGAARDRVESLAASFSTAAAQIRQRPAAESKFPGLDIQQQIGEARRALASGDLEGAIAGAEGARDLIVQIARTGREGQAVLTFLLEQARQVGAQAAEALAAQEEAQRKKIEQTLIDLAARAKSLESLKVGFDESKAKAAADSLHAQLQESFNARPLTIPVVLKRMGREQAGGQGEPIERFRRGGLHRGPNGIDNLLAWVSPGEYTVKRQAVAHYGANALAKINAMALPRFAEGGLMTTAGAIMREPRGAATAGRPIHLHLDGEQFAMSASQDVGNRLMTLVSREALKRGKT